MIDDDLIKAEIHLLGKDCGFTCIDALAHFYVRNGQAYLAITLNLNERVRRKSGASGINGCRGFRERVSIF